MLQSTPWLLMAINFINRQLYTVHCRTVGRWHSTARNYGIIHSPLDKYFVRDVI